jgi:hypothetical protein
MTFDIVSGSRLWTEIVGVPPKPGDTSTETTLRKYILQQVNHVKQLRLYMRVTDPGEGRTIGVQYLGNMLLFNRPQTVVDARSRLHLLHQSSGRGYLYHLIDTDGQLLERRTYEITQGRPQLRMNDSGDVLVIGGVRRFSQSDYPPPDDRTVAPKKEIER